MVDLTVPITYLDNSPVVPLAGTPNQFSGGGGYLKPFYVNATVIGTAVGNATINAETRPEEDEKPVFISVVQAVLKTNSTNVGFVRFGGLATADWPEYGTRERYATVDVTETFIPFYASNIDNPMAMGRLLVMTKGELTAVWETDVTGKTYKLEIYGWISDRPFLTPLTYFPG